MNEELKKIKAEYLYLHAPLLMGLGGPKQSQVYRRLEQLRAVYIELGGNGDDLPPAR